MTDIPWSDVEMLVNGEPVYDEQAKRRLTRELEITFVPGAWEAACRILADRIRSQQIGHELAADRT